MTPSPAAPGPTFAQATGSFVSAFGGRYYRISDVQTMATFFMNVATPSNLWLFLASNGGLTAGRCDAENALFPYQTVDKIYDSAGVTGPGTMLRLDGGAEDLRWEPFAAHTTQVHAVKRNLYKSIEGDRVWFEEINPALGLVFRYGWSTADRYGFIRQCELENIGTQPVSGRVLDSLRNLLPPGIGTRLQTGSSCLADAYKTAEALPDSSLAVYSLSAGIVDRPIPLESLRASVVWSHGLPGARLLLSDAQFDAFAAGQELTRETRRRGVRNHYAITAGFTLAPGARQQWLMVADTNLTQADVADLSLQLADGSLPGRVLAAADASTARLRAIVAASDGLQTGGDETVGVHHFANVLFNVMRGGIFSDNHQLPGADFARFVGVHHVPTARKHQAMLAALPASLDRRELLARADATGDTNLARLAAEYLPLTFSRRHGDPSRPWNRFRIHVNDEQGRRILAHEGNWRDIFQNWESLCLSYPDFYEAVVAKFVSASTADGYNPYRLTHTGLDWEVPEADDPWAAIGYWGDHQVVYLLKLLEWSARYHPGRLAGPLRQPLYAYANVPYRIAGYDEIRRAPRETITFDAASHRAITKEIGRIGNDARLRTDADGAIRHANLTEKLLVLLLTRLTNLIPEAGIWMNTQRPEWNDANNALVGYGVSTVTVCYLRRLIAHCRTVLLPELGSEPVPVAAAVTRLARSILSTLEKNQGLLAAPAIGDGPRRELVDALSGAGGDYRNRIYHEGLGQPAAYGTDELASLLALAERYVEHTIRACRRPDGLYHAYNLLEFRDQPAELRLHRLSPMLEGQVAVLSSGLLSAAESLALLDALRASPLYRADQHSYLLYPDGERAGFLERNTVPEKLVAGCPLLRDLAAAGDTRLIVRDAAGTCRFHPDLANGDAVAGRLKQLAADPAWAGAVATGSAPVLAVYEQVFHHRAFTGRSGSMFGYEGLGCIYWHMVAKLLLATQEAYLSARAEHAPETARLAECYYDIRAGLGFNKTPPVYGAFPTDPYSHTPGHSGAQQPGMTGQVKEEILTRFGELGLVVRDGGVAFHPTLLRAEEFTTLPSAFTYLSTGGQPASLPLPAGALAFTFCGVPVVYHLGVGPRQLRVHAANGSVNLITGCQLPAEASAELFSRTGRTHLLEVQLGADYRPL